MELSSVFLLIIYSLGAIQGIFFGIVLIKGNDSRNKTANKILSFILFALSYRLFIQCLRIFGIGYYDTWYYFMIDVNWVFGPLLYFYTRSIVVPGKKLTRKDWIHFLPLLIQIAFSEFVRLQNLYWDGTRESLSWLGYWGYVAWMNMPTVNLVASAIIVVYSIKSLRLLAYQKSLPNVKEDHSEWIKRIILSFAIYFTLIFGILIIDLSSYEDLPWYFHFEQFYYYPYFIGLAILTYWLGFEGYKRRNQAGILFRSELSGSDKTQLESVLHSIKEAMVREQLFKDPELSLNSLAEKVGIKSYLITKSLSEIEGVSFRDFLNLYRLEEFKRMMNAPEAKNYDLLSLALEVGFNSKSSFNRAVKKHYGILPSELRSSQ
ncbi:helix-turn-helix domain-containing protein [Cryomorphaceae bacterium 1068]|nr:helix-turn-helix domain-containing protein [Cryomorphaceae bacterium 1068]